MVSKAQRLAELRALRASGKSRLTTYEVEDARSLYDEVDEERYKNVVRGRLDRDDFIVDDNGEGYADDGREEWHADGRRFYESDSASDSEVPLRGKAAKRKREEDRDQQQKIDAGISKYFNSNPQAKVPKPKPAATADDAAFMADLLGEVDVNIPSRTVEGPLKAMRTESRRKTRILSPPLSESKAAPRKPVHLEPVSDMDTHPLEDACDDSGDWPAIDNDVGDTVMSDPLVASSPVAQAVKRKAQALAPDEDNDDDMMEVAQVTAHTGIVSQNVNKSGSRPVPKPKKQEYPTPQSSSPTKPPEDNVDPSAWSEIADKLNVVAANPSNDAASAGKLQAQDAVEEDGSLRFFWIDYTELNGSLLLFGKVKNKKSGKFCSCFVKVDNIMRKLFFLPREYRRKNSRDTDEEVDMSDVYEEVSELMSKVTSKAQDKYKIKPCSRKYAFEMPEVPREAEYLKLLYSYEKPPLPVETTGQTFSHVFGTNTSLFEQFVLWKNIMGPCWLRIDDADFSAVNNASWCKLELQADRPSSITVLGDSDNLEAPPLTMMSIALRTIMNLKENKQEILVATARIYEDISLTDTTPPIKLPCKTLTVMRPIEDGFPTGFKFDMEKHKGTVKLEKSEQGLLSLFLAHLQRIDPDVLVGHRLEDLDFSLLLSRLRDRKTPGWHRIGRLRRSAWPGSMGKGGGGFFAERQIVSGRLLCDLANDMGKSLMTKCQSWSLAEMCELVLGKGNIRRDMDENTLRTWAKTRQGLMDTLNHCELDTYFVAAIAMRLQMLPLTKVLTNLAGNSWARTLTGTRAERNEYILLHEFHRNKYICPDKVYGKGKQKVEEEPLEGEENVDAKKKDKFKGGLVFEPEKGLYDRVVLVMDFNSLYPSIIQEYNICFTTVQRAGMQAEEDQVPEVPDDQDQGILPRLIATLVNRRREVKKLMKDKTATVDQLATWDIKQLALKLTANSMYGCLGYTRSRFYARPLAMLTTFKGREILRSTKELAETQQLQVIYGDTDSVMINTNMDNIQDAIKVGNQFKRAVNERYRLLEIDIDNTFRRLLLHAKKKYAAVNMVEIDGKLVDKLEVKGLDMRRREYCALSKETSSKILNRLLLSGEEPETAVSKIHDDLRDLAEKMREFKVPVQKYTIFNQLSKAPTDYPNPKSMPPVQAALRLIAKGKPVRAKDVMSFIITGANNGSQESAAANALPPEDVLAKDSGHKPDIDYYLHKQILPPVERLCAPISLTNVTRIAECLGLDTSKYRVTGGGAARDSPGNDILQPLDSQVPDAIRFADCAPLHFLCLAPACRHPFTYASLASAAAAHAVTPDGLACPRCSTPLRNLAAAAQLEAQARTLLARYYEGWLACDEPGCGARTRQMSVYGHRCLGPRGLGRGCLGRMQWVVSEKHVWNQLVFWERAFDVDRAKEAPVGLGMAGGGQGVSQEGEASRGEVSVLAEVNRVRFETLRGVVRAYLDKSGRQWVGMGSLFAFVR